MFAARTRSELSATISRRLVEVVAEIRAAYFELTKRFPEIRFNADFSHYYCGQEMVYGDFEAKLDFMAPIFERVGFIHGRIAAPSRPERSATPTPSSATSTVVME